MKKLFYVFVAFYLVMVVSHSFAEGGKINEPARTLIGYSSELTVRPGDTIEFMVNAMHGGKYHADLVRVINGESRSIYGDLFKLKQVEASFEGNYEGVLQPLNLGSYVHIEDAQVLNKLESFTVGAWIYPVFDPAEYTPPDLENPDPFHPPTLTMAPLILDKPQTIVSRFDASTGTGWALRLNPDFQLEFVGGAGSGELKTAKVPVHVRDWDWAYVAATYDAKTGSVTAHLREKPYAPGDQFTARNAEGQTAVNALPQKGPLRIAASRGGPGALAARFEKPIDVFNGRIQDVRILKRVLSVEEIDALANEVVPTELSDATIVDFDFGREIKSTQAIDVSRSKLEGVIVNLPNRAVRGRFWNGSIIKWTDNPDQYDAITFYADDLYDAEWKPAFQYKVPSDLPSGVYAARLKQGNFVEYITFFVAAPKGKPGAKLAFWASDFNYLAYANISLGVTAKKNYASHNWNEADIAFMRDNIEYGTGGVYNTHVDTRNFGYGSRKRPDLHMKPGALTYNFAQDMHIVAFLEHFSIAYDVITDELVDQEGITLLNQYDAIISSTHPEYITQAIFDTVANYTGQGGRFMYIGGNGYFWSVGTHPQLPGVMESRNFFDIADRYLTNGNRGGLLVETGLHTGPVFGNEMSGMIFNGSSPYRKLEDANNPRAAWIFKDTSEGMVFGDYGVDRVHGGAAGFEIDKYDPSNGVPRHALQLATSEKLREKIEDVKMSIMPLSIYYHPASEDVHARADLVFFETPKGGAMFSTGSITWMSSTPENSYDNDVARITLNVIRRFLDPAPFPAIGLNETRDVYRAPKNPEYEHADQQ
jgi:N,N-dimethylformamidase